MKLCKDCKHYREAEYEEKTYGLFPFREKFKVTKKNPACNAVRHLEDGANIRIKYARSNEQLELMSEICGSEGKYWEAK